MKKEKKETRMPEIKDLKKNKYGHVKGIPKGFCTSHLTTAQLRKLGIATAKCFLGYVEGRQYFQPRLANLIALKDKHIVEGYIKGDMEKATSNKQTEIF